VSLNVYRADGTLARRLMSGAALDAGDHEVPATGLPPGEYTWRAVFHGELGMKALGRIGDFGGDRGPATAAAADDRQVYLGWALATGDGDTVVACDPAWTVCWRHRRGALSGCRGLAADGGLVYVLGGEGTADAEGRAIYRLDAKTGTIVPWPDGRVDLRIVSLWPANGQYKPDRANCMAVKNGRIYLSFSQGQFVAILDAKSGKYLQTIVGGAPGAIDVVGTKSDEPGNPGQSIESDFVVMTLKTGEIVKMLLGHDPIWVLASDVTSLEAGQKVTAVTMIGDAAKYHARDIFVALGRPWDQVEARSALDTDTVSYRAGERGGPVTSGVWQPEQMGDIRGIALDATGQLWVAEGEAIPSRISVWTTDEATGTLVREFFAPPNVTSPVAIDPLDGGVIVAGGCEWRVYPKTGRAACMGVITPEIYSRARFAVDQGRLLLALTPAKGPDVVLERIGDGDYQPYAGATPAEKASKYQLLPQPDGEWDLATADGFDLGYGLGGVQKITTGISISYNGTGGVAPVLGELADGRVMVAVREVGLTEFEITGLETVKALGQGKVVVGAK